MASKDYVLPDAKAINKLLVKENDSSTAVIIRLAWQAGLTATEIVELRWDDVDLNDRTLCVSGRTVPLCEDLLNFLGNLDHQGAYVAHSLKSKGGPMSRISASNKARTALDSVGQTKVRLWDLRFDYIAGLLQSQPIEEVSRITDCELRSLREIHKRFVQQSPPSKRAKKRNWLDNERLQKAIEIEHDTLDAKIIVFAWIYDLSLDEISNLMWKDIELSGKKLIIGGSKYDVPTTIFDVLRSEKASSAGNQYVLHGNRSGNQLPADFLSRRAGEFFVRHGMEHYTISGIRGKYGTPSDKTFKGHITSLLSDTDGLKLAKIALALDLDKANTSRLLHELVSAGKVKVSQKGLYMLTEHQTNWEIFMQAVDVLFFRNSIVSPAEIAEATGFGRNLIDYYLKRALSKGLIIKATRGQYQRPKK